MRIYNKFRLAFRNTRKHEVNKAKANKAMAAAVVNVIELLELQQKLFIRHPTTPSPSLRLNPLVLHGVRNGPRSRSNTHVHLDYAFFNALVPAIVYKEGRTNLVLHIGHAFPSDTRNYHFFMLKLVTCGFQKKHAWHSNVPWPLVLSFDLHVARDEQHAREEDFLTAKRGVGEIKGEIWRGMHLCDKGRAIVWEAYIGSGPDRRVTMSGMIDSASTLGDLVAEGERLRW